ncbi:MAG: signal peptidase I [Candidatus Pacebacteria bacterium]|nr:signal peptidase I [Candidatus Paceibacterota bacterium]
MNNEIQPEENQDFEKPIKKTVDEPSRWELFRFAIILLAIFIPLRIFVASPFVVYGSSMEPNFNTGDYLIVDELSYHFHTPNRGDVIVLTPPVSDKKYFIKRVIGLPNETVSVDGDQVYIINADHPKGFELKEPYLAFHKGPQGTWHLGPDEYFVMGDNRDVSSDSRSWGPLKADKIAGRAFLRLYPFNKISLLPAQGYTYQP